MKKLTMLVLAGIIGVLTGCSSINIAELPITERDKQSYLNHSQKEYSEIVGNPIKLVIVPQNVLKDRWKDRRTLTTVKSLTNSFGDALDTAFGNLAAYEVVPRNEIGAIKADMALSGIKLKKDYKAKNVNYMVIYRVSSYNFEMFKSYGKNATPRYKAYVKVKVTLISLKENIKKYTKTITGESEKSDSQNIGLLNQAIENAVKDFSTQFAIDHAPAGIVLQTKGSGQIALINIGKNWGLMKKMKMEFFTNKKVKANTLIIPFAYGKIIEIGKNTAWIEIDNYKSANVKQNNFIRIRRDQSRSFLEKL